MSIDAFTRALGRAVQLARAEISSAPSDGRAAWARISKSTIEPVQVALRQIDEIATQDGKCVSTPGSSGLFDLDSSAIHLVYNAIFYGVENVSASLIDIFRSKRIRTATIYSLAGLSVHHDIEIEENISLIPGGNAPNVENSQRVFSPQNTEGHVFSFAPSSALRIRREVELDFYQRSEGGEDFIGIGEAPEVKKIPAILAAISLASGAVPEQRETYHVILDVGWPGMLSNGLGGSRGFPKNIPFDQPIAEDDLRSIYDLIVKNGNVDISLAIAKLNSARCKDGFADKVIDYGTLLEILLMHNSGNSGEITEKLALRAAWLLGSDVESRNEVYDMTKNMYRMRSSAVHNGTIEKELNKIGNSDDHHSVFSRYDSLCRQVAVSILERGGWPNDWKVLVLGG